MKIAITGANGFVGAALCRYFFKAGHEIIALGNRRNPHPNLFKVATYQQVDISKVMREIEAEVCIHTAALPSDTDTYKSMIISNVEGTLNVVEAAKNCSHLFHISSSSVYQFEGTPVSEDAATIHSTLSDYGETKLLAEDIIDLNIPSHQKRIILRPRVIYGAGDRILLPRIFRLIAGSYLLCPVKKHIQTSLTHIDNIGYAIDLFLTQKAYKPLQIMNVSDDHPYFLREVVQKLASAIEGRNLSLMPMSPFLLDIFLYLNSKTEIVKQISRPVLNSLNRNTVLDISKIKRELNYRPEKNFENSYLEIAEWVRSFESKDHYLKNLHNAPWQVKL